MGLEKEHTGTAWRCLIKSGFPLWSILLIVAEPEFRNIPATEPRQVEVEGSGFGFRV